MNCGNIWRKGFYVIVWTNIQIRDILSYQYIFIYKAWRGLRVLHSWLEQQARNRFQIRKMIIRIFFYNSHNQLLNINIESDLICFPRKWLLPFYYSFGLKENIESTLKQNIYSFSASFSLFSYCLKWSPAVATFIGILTMGIFAHLTMCLLAFARDKLWYRMSYKKGPLSIFLVEVRHFIY